MPTSYYYTPQKPSPKQPNQPSVFRFIFAALLLLVLPFSVILYQLNHLDNGTPLRLPLQISKIDTDVIVPKAIFLTPLNQISNDNIIGGNHLVVDTKVFVFLSPGPNDIWYPYAVTKRPPEEGCQNDKCLILNGRIIAVNNDSLSIAYSYENFVAEVPLLEKLREATTYATDLEVTLSVGKDGRAIVRSIHLGNETIDQRKRLIPTLSGFSHKGASTMPANIPPI